MQSQKSNQTKVGTTQQCLLRITFPTYLGIFPIMSCGTCYREVTGRYSLTQLQCGFLLQVFLYVISIANALKLICSWSNVAIQILEMVDVIVVDWGRIQGVSRKVVHVFLVLTSFVNL